MSAPTTIEEAIRRMESLRPGVAVSIVDRLHLPRGDGAFRFHAFAEVSEGNEMVGRGHTRMEAMQEALRKVQMWHEDNLRRPFAVEPDGQLSIWPTR